MLNYITVFAMRWFCYFRT